MSNEPLNVKPAHRSLRAESMVEVNYIFVVFLFFCKRLTVKGDLLLMCCSYIASAASISLVFALRMRSILCAQFMASSLLLFPAAFCCK